MNFKIVIDFYELFRLKFINKHLSLKYFEIGKVFIHQKKHMKNKILSIQKYFEKGIFEEKLYKMPKYRAFYIRFLQIILLTVKGFQKDRLNEQASAMTYFTMLSIVPVLALGFGIAKGFGMEAVLEDEIAKNFAGQKEALDYILSFTRSMLNTAKGGLVAGIGLGVLIWSVLKLLINIENSFNYIWDIHESRPIVRKVTDYFAIMLLSPILMILSSGMAVYISTTFSDITTKSEVLALASPLAVFLAKLTPYFIVWVLFSILYMVMPNTKVTIKSAVVAGLIAGTIFQLFQGLYIATQSGASRVSAIYGSFAALPLFLVWLQISWTVVLLGCKIAHIVQTVQMKTFDSEFSGFSIDFRKKIALLISSNIVRKFENSEKAPTIKEISAEIAVPYQVVELICEQLVTAGLFSKVLNKSSDDEISFLPSGNTDKIDIAAVIEKYEELGYDSSDFDIDEKNKKLLSEFERLKTCLKENQANIKLKLT